MSEATIEAMLSIVIWAGSTLYMGMCIYDWR